MRTEHWHTVTQLTRYLHSNWSVGAFVEEFAEELFVQLHLTAPKPSGDCFLF